MSDLLQFITEFFSVFADFLATEPVFYIVGFILASIVVSMLIKLFRV